MILEKFLIKKWMFLFFIRKIKQEVCITKFFNFKFFNKFSEKLKHIRTPYYQKYYWYDNR